MLANGLVEQKQAVNLCKQQSLVVLQFSMEELSEFIQQEYSENPLLEYEECSSANIEKYLSLKKMHRLFGEPIKERYDEKSAWESNQHLQGFTYDGDFKSSLKEQVFCREIQGSLLNIVESMVELLDEKGYLPYTTVELAAILGCGRSECNKARSILQNLLPHGVGHYDLRDFLIHQLEQKGIINEALRRMCKYYLPQIGRKNYRHIADELGIDTELVSGYVKSISKLHSSPIQYGSTHALEKYKIADVIIRQDGDIFTVDFNDNLVGSIGISKYYKYYLKCANDDKTKEYIQQKMRRAKWVCEAVEKRRKTVLSIAAQLTVVQKEFFTNGKIHALTHRELAECLDLHESTIIRAVNGKYLYCSRGVYPFCQFFQSSVYNISCKKRVFQSIL